MVAFVSVWLVAETWVPEYLAFGLGFAAMTLLQKPVIENPERPIAMRRHLLMVGVSAAVAMTLRLLFDAWLGP